MINQKSTIAVTSRTKELMELLEQHYRGVLCFVAATCAKTTDAAWIDDRDSTTLIIRMREGSDVLNLEKPFNISRVVQFLDNKLYNANQHIIVLPGIELDCQHDVLMVHQDTIHLTEKETLLLQCLMQAYPTIVSKQALLETVWHYTHEMDTQTLPAHLYRLRQKLGEYSHIIQTRDEGYVLQINS